ncbi:MAG: hypothetical protein Q8J89_09525 [Caulobacter sp.]|nr:hypothetical protein [Caulobacter sp.]
MSKPLFDIGDRVHVEGSPGTIVGFERGESGGVYLIIYDTDAGVIQRRPVSTIDGLAEATRQQAQASADIGPGLGAQGAEATSSHKGTHSERAGAFLGGLVILAVVLFVVSRCSEAPPTSEAYRAVELGPAYGSSSMRAHAGGEVELSEPGLVREALASCASELRKLPDAFGDVELTLLYLESVERECGARIEAEDSCETAFYQAQIAGNSYRLGELGQVDAALDQFSSSRRRCLADLAARAADGR